MRARARCLIAHRTSPPPSNNTQQYIYTHTHNTLSRLCSLNTQAVSLILTAHPTEVNRKTLLTQTLCVQTHLASADSLRLSGGGEYERREVSKGLEAAVQGIWMSDEVSR